MVIFLMVPVAFGLQFLFSNLTTVSLTCRVVADMARDRNHSCHFVLFPPSFYCWG